MKLSLIVAADEGGVIGLNGKIPWHISADLKHFKELTMGHPIIMGRKTFESIGKPLPGRINIVLTNNPDYEAAGCITVRSLVDALRAAEDKLAGDSGEIFVVGGAHVYKLALTHADKVYMTRVHGNFEGDVRFPALNDSEWRLVQSEEHEKDEKNPLDYAFQVYERI